MKIDYFCFSVPNLNTTDYCVNKYDNENAILIKTKEQEFMNSAS